MLTKAKFSLTAFFSLAMIAATARAGLIDFEAFAPFQNINGLDLGGVTITNPYNGNVIIYDDTFQLGYHSATKSFTANDFMEITNRLVAVFDSPQSFVRLWSGNAFDGYVPGWQIEAFDAPVGGNSLGVVQSGAWAGSPYSPLEITAPNIMRIEFGLYPSVGPGVAFDDLEFTPEPASVLALIPALLILRRRRSSLP